MSVQTQIKAHLANLPDAKREEMQALHGMILRLMRGCRLWFLDGKTEDGRTVSNPNIGYGILTMKQAGGRTREFYQIGLSANTSGISVYIMGLSDRKYLEQTYGATIGKATVTGYCIKFRTVSNIDLGVLEEAIRDGVRQTQT